MALEFAYRIVLAPLHWDMFQVYIRQRLVFSQVYRELVVFPLELVAPCRILVTLVQGYHPAYLVLSQELVGPLSLMVAPCHILDKVVQRSHCRLEPMAFLVISLAQVLILLHLKLYTRWMVFQSQEVHSVLDHLELVTQIHQVQEASIIPKQFLHHE